MFILNIWSRTLSVADMASAYRGTLASGDMFSLVMEGASKNYEIKDNSGGFLTVRSDVVSVRRKRSSSSSAGLPGE